MRFAVSLLMFICVASVIGTVLPQNQASNTYIDQFGPFWYALFDVFALWHVYNSWWFLTIMAFLVVSTSLCLLRNTPKMVEDMRSFREYVRGSSLRAFHHKLEADTPYSPAQSSQKLTQWLNKQGYKVKVRQDGDSQLLAAKKGSANRLGYIFAHAAIVIICVGGILDSELPVRLQVWLGGKAPITENMLIKDVPESGWLSVANPSYRANLLIPEGSQSSSAIVAVGDGVLVQPMPFSLRLKQFDIEYYSTGMPSRFASHVEVSDPDTGETFEQVIEVNEPLRYKGVTVYQSSFDDGGSRVQLKAWPLSGNNTEAFNIDTTVGDPTNITLNASTEQPERYQLNVTDLRIINVENLEINADPQPRAVLDHVAAVTGSATTLKNENLRNVGPSVQYRLTGTDGQSFEYHNYMMPIALDSGPVFLVGVRNRPAQAFRYIRIPADADNSLASFIHLRTALSNPELRQKAAQQFAAQSANSESQKELLEKAAAGALEAFSKGGFSRLLEPVPETERGRFLSFAVPMIQLSLSALYDLDRAQRGLPELTYNEAQSNAHNQWMQQALLALSNLPDYPAPIVMSLTQFDHVQASVFQVARSPGQTTVYLGCLFLVIGIFSMFYIRDRRIWIWVQPKHTGSQWLAAMTSQRRTLDFTQEFERFKNAFKQLST
ncbi:MAG: cytochrome c biogenesis protein ResB [Pusillimonas sp.]|nr:cytochrome c biogenesis protein ResB [Pusillimonas sp.]